MTKEVSTLKTYRLFALTVLAPLTLSACGGSGNEDDTSAEAFDGSAPLGEEAAFDGSAGVDNGETYDDPMPEPEVFDGSGTDAVTPEIGGTEPMDSAEPMGGTEPTAEGFGSNEGLGSNEVG